MRIHFVISIDELPLYRELLKQLKSLGHNVTSGPVCRDEVDAVICRGNTTPVPSVQFEKLTDTISRADSRLKRLVEPTAVKPSGSN